MSYTAEEFETLYTSCFTPSMRLALSLLRDQDEARDAVHEVFVRLWQSTLHIDNPQAFVIRSVRNACITRLNALSTREKIHRRLALSAPEADDDTDIEDQHEEVRTAVRLLLSERERQALERVYSHGQSYKEAADHLGLSVASIHKNLVNALKKLRTHFKTAQT